MSRRLPLAATAWLAATSLALGQNAGGAPMLPSGGASGPPAIVPATAGDNVYVPLWPATIGTGASAPPQNTAKCAPFYIGVAEHVDQAIINVTTLGTGPLNFAIYSDAIDATTNRHQPQSPLTASTVTFTVTSTGSPTAALGSAGVGIALPAGLNWACTNDTNASDAVRTTVTAASNAYMATIMGASLAGGAVGASPTTSLTVSQTAGTSGANWPSLAGVSMTEGTAGDINMALRVVSVP